jgi:Zn finger protein HypA/HybF involved in hydrogenase expression
MPNRAVKFWKRIGQDEFEPHSTSVKDRNLVMYYRGKEAWCPHCKSVVEPVEMIFGGGGFVPSCPFCEVAV